MIGWFYGIVIPTIWAITLFCAYTMGRIDEHLRHNERKGQVIDFTPRRRGR